MLLGSPMFVLLKRIRLTPIPFEQAWNKIIAEYCNFIWPTTNQNPWFLSWPRCQQYVTQRSQWQTAYRKSYVLTLGRMHDVKTMSNSIFSSCGYFWWLFWDLPASWDIPMSQTGLTPLFIIIPLVDSNIHHVFDWLICLLPGNLVKRKSKITRWWNKYLNLSVQEAGFVFLYFSEKKSKA